MLLVNSHSHSHEEEGGGDCLGSCWVGVSARSKDTLVRGCGLAKRYHIPPPTGLLRHGINTTLMGTHIGLSDVVNVILRWL